MVQLFVFKGSEVLGYVRQSNRLCIVNLPRPAAGQKKTCHASDYPEALWFKLTFIPLSLCLSKAVKPVNQ